MQRKSLIIERKLVSLSQEETKRASIIAGNGEGERGAARIPR